MSSRGETQRIAYINYDVTHQFLLVVSVLKIYHTKCPPAYWSINDYVYDLAQELSDGKPTVRITC
jgi:hypothetical protein